MDYYAVQQQEANRIVLQERNFTEAGKTTLKVPLEFNGDAFAIKLDKASDTKNHGAKKKKGDKGEHQPLFHFLDNNGKPWSKRCDFVIFHLNRKINVYCIEFKYKTLPVESVMAQLEASSSWCKSLGSTIKNYTGKYRRISLTKYVLSMHSDPSDYLDRAGKYLKRDHSIRHYDYGEISGMKLESLDNTSIEYIG